METAPEFPQQLSTRLEIQPLTKCARGGDAKTSQQYVWVQWELYSGCVCIKYQLDISSNIYILARLLRGFLSF